MKLWWNIFIKAERTDNMIIESDNTVTIIRGISFKSFPILKKYLVQYNTRTAYYKEQYEEEMDEGLWDIYVFKGIRSLQPNISFIKSEKSNERTYSRIYVGIDWLMNKVKEDDALLAEVFILKMNGFKD
jgi:hypothetical protein